jgi:[ribosomal protein S5]-alanine N-acetyltransferase
VSPHLATKAVERRAFKRVDRGDDRDSRGVPREAGLALARRQRLPTLRGGTVVLRELQQDDAPSLMAHLGDPAVLEFVSGAPRTTAEFRRFIRWSHEERRLRGHLTFGVVPAGARTPVGIVQMWPIEPGFRTAEWGFVVGKAFWGTGAFHDAARLLLRFAFLRLGVRRLEARTVAGDRRGTRALRRLGAIAEGRLRAGFHCRGAVLDHVMWSILATDWTAPGNTARDGR